MRLRHILLLTFTTIAVIPVTFLAFWVYVNALDRELDEVRERHLLLAENISAALERYVRDLEASFTLVSQVAFEGEITPAYAQYMLELDFVHFCTFDLADRSLTHEIVPGHLPCPKAIPEKRFDLFRTLTDGDKVAFSKVLPNPQGDPTIYLLSERRDHLIVGAISTEYIVNQGDSIMFGRRGHAAIVDQTGQVIAHPRPEWRAEIKDISKVSAVQQMMRREFGTTRFYSPAMEADMVAGFTYVPRSGWGVMVPQPLSELEENAEAVQVWALQVGIIGLIGAILVAWFVAKYLNSPIAAVAGAAQRMADGDLDARVRFKGGLRPREIEELGETFDTMAGKVKEANDSMKHALTLAQEATKAKTEFLSSITHEIRTPINGIVGLSELLAETDLDEKQREMIGLLVDSSHSVLTIVGSVLDMSKIEAGRLDLDLQPVAVDQVVQDSVKSLEMRAQEKGIDLRYDIADGVPAFVMSDPHRLRQILVNLIGNAVKFTDKGSVTVRAKDTEDGDGVSWLTFSIIDTGIGMSETELENVFQPFEQINATTTDRRGGTGLGLAISKELAGLLGGSIEVSSTPGEGSTFRLHHPLYRVDRPAGAPPAIDDTDVFDADEDEKSDGGTVRVLVAEDHPTNQWLLERQLRQLGYDVTVTGNGSEALNAFKQDPYDVVITDYLMPEMDGAMLAQAIRRLTSVEKKSVPIVGLTANAFEDAIASLKAAGASIVITKPTVKKALDNAIKTALKAPLDAEGAADPNDMVDVVFNPEHCMDLFGEEPRKGVAWLQDFLDNADNAFREMRECVRTGDRQGLADRLHTLAGAAAGVGAAELGVAARTLSLAAKGSDAPLDDDFKRLLETYGHTKRSMEDFIGQLLSHV
ncbi:MAG: ATP-binding protein [Alphaproteobacteria bacterium]|nr:ATP-binding protein [Alphaproteobacteria bacterium]